MANYKQLDLGLQVKEAREKLSNAQERLKLVLETQAIYESIFDNSDGVISDVIIRAASKADKAVLAAKIKFDEAQENLRLVKRVHFSMDDADNADDDSDVDDAYDGYDSDGYDSDGYDVRGYDVGGYDVDGLNVYGIPAFNVDWYEYIE